MERYNVVITEVDTRHSDEMRLVKKPLDIDVVYWRSQSGAYLRTWRFTEHHLQLMMGRLAAYSKSKLRCEEQLVAGYVLEGAQGCVQQGVQGWGWQILQYVSCRIGDTDMYATHCP